MSERNYYVICDDNCRFEGMTKEQIYDAIAEATGSTPTPVDSAFITKIKEQNANHSLKVWKGTEAQYNALAEKDSDTLYIITRPDVAPRIINSTILEEKIDEIHAEIKPVMTVRFHTSVENVSAVKVFWTEFDISQVAYPEGFVWTGIASVNPNDNDEVIAIATKGKYADVRIKCYDNNPSSNKHIPLDIDFLFVKE